ncbi:MAG: hypothetical protein FWF90_05300 [Promicromonosporaceae bacterium]|nr:hypothetical protein [Promicromonosporaceae bacterium]
MTPTGRRLRSTSVTLGITALIAAGVAGCGHVVDNQGICVDPQTQKRVADYLCDRGGSGGGGGYAWYYLRSGSAIPGVGRSYAGSGGTFDEGTLHGTTSHGGVSSSGEGGSSGESGSHGSVARGGFGGSAHVGS